MAYIVLADFRSASLKWFTRNLALSMTEASDAQLTEAITWASDLIDRECDDHFEPYGANDADTTIEVDGRGLSMVRLPVRARSITQVQTRDVNGNLTVETAGTYKLDSSLDSAGIKAEAVADYLSVAPEKSLSGGVKVWPAGDNRIRITGKFGWATPPGDIKHAVALLVFDRLKPQSVDQLRRVRSHSTADAQFDMAMTEPTGIPEVDRVIATFRREYV